MTSQQIRAARQAAGLTQAELARRLSLEVDRTIATSQIGRWEGGSNPNFFYARALAKVLNIKDGEALETHSKGEVRQ